MLRKHRGSTRLRVSNPMSPAARYVWLACLIMILADDRASAKCGPKDLRVALTLRSTEAPSWFGSSGELRVGPGGVGSESLRIDVLDVDGDGNFELLFAEQVDP